MGLFSSKKLALPPPPEYWSDERFGSGINELFSESSRLRNFDFGDNSMMAETISLDPEISRLALEQAQGALTPAFNRQRQNTINELANLGGLQSSTAANSLTQLDFDLLSQLQGITAGAALDDRTRALDNRMSLFGTGLNLLQTGTQYAGQNEQNRNAFNQQQYENQVASAMATQPAQKGGLAGGLTGALGGAGLGIALAPFTGGLSLGLTAALAGAGGLAGAAGPAGTGGQIMNAGAMMFGSGLGKQPVAPGSTAGVGDLLAKRPSYQNSQYSMKSGFNSLYN